MSLSHAQDLYDMRLGSASNSETPPGCCTLPLLHLVPWIMNPTVVPGLSVSSLEGTFFYPFRANSSTLEKLHKAILFPNRSKQRLG